MGGDSPGSRRTGKHLLVEVDHGDSVHVHLGMRGKWLRFAPVTGPGLPQVRLRLAVPEVPWDLIAPQHLRAAGRSRSGEAGRQSGTGSPAGRR